MGLFSSIASIFSGGQQAKAAKQAATAQMGAAQQGIDALSPYSTTGTKALGAQGDLLGLNGGDGQQTAITALQASPLYQSLFRTGQEAILQNGSATGGLRGGNIQGSLANFGSDTLAKVIQSQLSNLSGLSSQGLTATGGIADLYGQKGAAQAGGILGKLAGHTQQTGGAVSGLENIAGSLNFSGSGQPGGQTSAQGIGQMIQSFI